MSELFNPILLYGGCALGALGLALAMPRRGVSPQLLGALIAAAGVGAMFLAVGLRAGLLGIPNFMFYVFAAIALGASLRVISHPRPVYAALYFILTILASAGLYLLLSAEFMAFALIIVYAGAILITYLFVIMLATESPTEDEVESLREYDRYSREPIAAAVIGFILVAMMATLLGRGAETLAAPAGYRDAGLIAALPGRIERELRHAGLIERGEAVRVDARGNAMIDLVERTAVVGPTDGAEGATEAAADRVVPLPAELSISNTEGVAFELIAANPGAIEIAGVILLMAMLGAVVLSRKRVEMDEGDRELIAAGVGGTGGAEGTGGHGGGGGRGGDHKGGNGTMPGGAGTRPAPAQGARA